LLENLEENEDQKDMEKVEAGESSGNTFLESRNKQFLMEEAPRGKLLKIRKSDFKKKDTLLKKKVSERDMKKLSPSLKLRMLLS
jgi:hypothetical protein